VLDTRGEASDNCVAPSSSNGVSSNGNSFLIDSEGCIESLEALSISVVQISGEDISLVMPPLLCMIGDPSSAAPPSHRIQSSHSSMSISTLKALSKTLRSGLASVRGVSSSKHPSEDRK
jgi:hypothetical protein